MLKAGMNSLKYLAAYTIPLSAFIGISQGGTWCYLTPFYAFLIIPVLEILLPEDEHNLEESQKKSQGINPVYDWMLYANIPIVYGLIWMAVALLFSQIRAVLRPWPSSQIRSLQYQPMLMGWPGA